MANLELSKHRIRNVGKHLPGGPRTKKLRDTLKKTVSGMRTLLGQMPQNSTDKIRAERKTAKKRLTLAAVVAVLAAFAAAGLFIWLLRY
jgi:hypothetical protein